MNQLSPYQEKEYRTATHCYMCTKIFQPTDVKVRDHCHLTGNYRGPAHSSCNLRYQVPKHLPIVFHNLSGYDSHFIIKELGGDDKKIDVIPNTEEKYISFTKYINKKIKLRFIDSYRFMAASLEKLAKGVSTFNELSQYFLPEHVTLLTRKGVFPYDYLDHPDKLKEEALPPKEKFYNKLNISHISEEDYKHAVKVWNTLNIKNLGEYCDLYIKTDVLLLADIFETFRDVTLKTHRLDPAHYFTLPGLTWDAMLKFTNIKLDLLQDYEQLMMVEKGIRGGICQVSHRMIDANNKHMKNYDPTKESVYIYYVDCNNLYGYAMSQPLPYEDFKWTNPNDINLEELTVESEYGAILDVEVEYPKHLHITHDALPFLCENILVNKQKKLVPHLNKRTNYVVHYLALKQALEHGVKLVKINRALSFKQKAWLKEYIDHNTKLRAQATTDFEKELYKLYNNAVYGKTMENIRNRLNMQLVTTSKQIEKFISKPEFIDRTIYHESLAAVHLAKKSLTFDKPIYLGMAILDISKIKMYSFHYDTMLPLYNNNNNLTLAYMDTDSFIYKIKTDDLVSDLTTIISELDGSDLPNNHPLYSNINKKVVGKFKDEGKGKVITKFVGLKPKMYAIQFEENIIKKIKGVQSAVVKNVITIQDYINCLETGQNLRSNVRQIRSYDHNVFSVQINKIALSSFDDKRIVMDDGINTRAIGFTDL